MRAVLPAVSVLATLLAVFTDASAQERPSRFSGSVVDASGAAVSGAVVRLNMEDGRAMEAVVGERGSFTFDVPAAFRLEVSRDGYRSVHTGDIVLAPGEAYEIRIVLLTGDPAEIERVELLVEEASQLTAAAFPLIRGDLPRPDRLFGLGGVNVSGIAEGASQEWAAASGGVFASSPTASTLIDPSRLPADFGPQMEDDESLRPGGRRPHGSAHYFHRNHRLNAQNYFDPPGAGPPPFQYHSFGAEFGGPLRPGTYGLARYWGLRLHQSVTRAATVPDPAEIQGDFSAFPLPIIDPETGFPFPGGMIPAGRIDPHGAALAALYPSPNAPGTRIQNYRTVGTLETVADAWGFRLDHRTTIADETSVEYQYNRDTTSDPFNFVTGITNLPGFGVRDALRTQTLRVSNLHVFTPSLLHDVRFSIGDLRQPRRLLSDAGLPAVIVTGYSSLGHATNTPQERRNRTVDAASDLAWAGPGRSTRVGGVIRRFRFSAFMDLYSRGQFQFNDSSFTGHALANLLLGLPAHAVRITGEADRSFRSWAAGVYVQQEWRVRANLDLSAGLRYDYQSPFEEALGRVANFSSSGSLEVSPERLYEPDADNWGPRVGLAWSPMPGAVLRAGYGIFYDQLAVGDSLFLLGLNPPFVRFEVENNDPLVPRFDLGSVFDDPSSSSPPSLFSASPLLANPYVQHWSVSLTRSLPGDYDVGVGYIGQKGTRLRRQVNRNQPSPGLPATMEERRPYPGFGNVFHFETSAASSAHALDAGLGRRFSGGVSLRMNYRWARFIDDASLINVLPQDRRNLAVERGLSDFHVQHRFSFAGVYRVPFLPGWRIQGLGIFQSGTPLSAVMAADVAGTGSPVVNRPHLIGDTRIEHPSPTRFFNTAAFETPAPGEFGTSGRNVIPGPGVANVDLALVAPLRLSDGFRAEFRADFYNALNRSNFVAPPSSQNFADSSQFGALFVARSPRVVQLGMRFFW